MNQLSVSEERDRNRLGYEAILRAKPLLGFSPTTQFQLEALLNCAAEVVRQLDAAIIPAKEGENARVLDSNAGRQVFWLWVLGAYELLRTLKQHRSCFAESANQRFKDCHDGLKLLRIPFAKLEFAGSTTPIGQEVIVCSHIDTAQRDYTYEIRGDLFPLRETMGEFFKVMQALSFDEVLRSREGDQMAKVIRWLAEHGAPPQTPS